MISQILNSLSEVWEALLIGGVVGSLFAMVVFLAKGGFKSDDAPYVVPFGLVWGVVAGYLVLELVVR